MQPSFSIDLNAPFWQDIPDADLENVYKQLEGGLDDIDDDMLDISDIAPPQIQNASLPALFPTPSLTDVSNLRGGSFQLQAQFNQANEQAKQAINQIAQLHDHQIEQINKMQTLQRQICQTGQTDNEKLAEQQYVLNQQINEELKRLRELNKTILLHPSELHKSRILGQRLQIQQQGLDLLCRELSLVGTGKGSDTLSALVIEDQPIPQVTFKGKALENNYTVRLLSGASVEYQNISKIKAQLVSEERTWKTAKPLENDETAMDFYHRIATFHNLKVQVSTRMSSVYLKFGIQVQQSTGVSPIIQSHPSYPMIVITNESQWCEAAGKLLVMDCFAGENEICWAQFANGLHHHFLKATRQEPGRPARSIKPHEFDFLHKKFFKAQNMITPQQANRFWTWFGQVTQTLRFKRHIATLWFTGLIFGLITKEECQAALESQEIGTFLIRFSESYAGLFAVAYVSDDPNERVKHYLVKPEDTGSQKTLPDFLREKPQFKLLYLLDTNTGTLSKFPKDSVLQSFYSKGKRLDSEQNGYVLL